MIRLLILFGVSLTAWTTHPLRAAEQRLLVNKGESRIEIRVKATFDSFIGTLANFEPTLTVDSEVKRFFQAKIAFQIVDVKTGRIERDRDLAIWSEHGLYPVSVFEMEEILPESVTGPHTVRGKVTLHGVTRSVQFPISVITDQQQYVIDGQAVIDTRNFGLPVIRKFWILKVDPIVKIRFHLQAALMDPSSYRPAP